MSQVDKHLPGNFTILRSEDRDDTGEVYGHGDCLVGPDEHLRREIWPTSVAIWAVAAYMAFFLIRPWETLFPWLAAIHFERTYSIAMIAVVAATRGIRLRMDRQNCAVQMFLTALVISAIFAWNPTLAWSDGQGLYVYLTLVVFYLILVSVVRSPYELVFLVACYVAIMGIYLGKCQWEFWVYSAGRRSMGVMRLRGISEMFGHPNALAATTVISLPLWYFLFRTRDIFTDTWPRFWHKWFRRAILMYPLLAIWTVVLANSRGGMLALIAFGGITVLRGRSMRKKLYCGMGILVISWVVWAMMDTSSKDRFRSIWDPDASTGSARTSAEGRAEGFRAGMEIFRRFPITGVGIGNFIEYRAGLVDGTRLAAHNLVGQVIGETGLLGSAGFLFIVVATFNNCHRTTVAARNRQGETWQVLSELGCALRDATILAIFCGLFCHNLYWFTWLWSAAFAVLAANFASTR